MNKLTIVQSFTSPVFQNVFPIFTMEKLMHKQGICYGNQLSAFRFEGIRMHIQEGTKVI